MKSIQNYPEVVLTCLSNIYLITHIVFKVRKAKSLNIVRPYASLESKIQCSCLTLFVHTMFFEIEVSEDDVRLTCKTKHLNYKKVLRGIY